MTKEALDAEADRGTTYTVTVRATDPSGMPQREAAQTANSDEITVTITVTGVDEPPVVTGNAEVTFEENNDITVPLATYTEDDPETTDDSTWSLSGTDSGKFEFDIDNSDGQLLTFEARPDFEMPGDANGDNVYEVTVVAADASGKRGTMDVKVTVANANEDGTVTLSRTQPRVGVAVRATLNDPDGRISGLTWQWYGTISENDLTGNAIEGAMSDTHIPTADDLGDILTARAMYTDGHGAMKSAEGAAAVVVVVDTRNKAPAFVDQDPETDGVQNESTEIMVEENIKALAGSDDDDATDVTDASADNVGSPVMAEDPDPNMEPLIYTLSGADASSFRVRDNGQIEVGAGTKLDYETQTTYMVTLTAEDSFGASASIMVTIMVTDMDEAPVIMVGGLAIGGSNNIDYAENGTMPVATYMAAGPDADMATWSLSGDDMGDFMFSGGMLTFRSSPDYENPMDADMDNVYMVTIMADDRTAYTDTHDVMVRVTNVDEMGRVTFWRDGADATTAAIMVGDMLGGLAEDPDGNVGDTPPITDMYPNITGATWQWAKTMTPDMMESWMDITGATDAAYTVMDADEGYHLRATAMYDDGEGMGKMASEETMMVGADDAGGTLFDPLAQYDADDSGAIEKDEVIQAIKDYLFGEGADAISKDDAIETIKLYLFS